MEARWTKKNSQSFYGYNDYVKAGVKTKLIHTFTVTAASTHDSQAMPELIASGDGAVHADSAYIGEISRRICGRKACTITSTKRVAPGPR